MWDVIPTSPSSICSALQAGVLGLSSLLVLPAALGWRRRLEDQDGWGFRSMWDLLGLPCLLPVQVGIALKTSRGEGKSLSPFRGEPLSVETALKLNACVDGELSTSRRSPHVLRQLTVSQTSFMEDLPHLRTGRNGRAVPSCETHHRRVGWAFRDIRLSGVFQSEPSET